MRCCSRENRGRPSSSSATSSPSSSTWSEPIASARLAELGEGDGHVVAVAALRSRSSTVDPEEHPEPVPLELVRPFALLCVPVEGELAGGGEHRGEVGRQRLEPVRRGVHPVDHPVLAVGGEEHVATLRPLAVEDDHDFAVAPLLGFVGPLVPDRDLPAAVFTGRDGSVEGAVLEWMVLDMNREVVLLRGEREALRQRPGRRRRRRARAGSPSGGSSRGAPG